VSRFVFYFILFGISKKKTKKRFNSCMLYCCSFKLLYRAILMQSGTTWTVESESINRLRFFLPPPRFSRNVRPLAFQRSTHARMFEGAGTAGTVEIRR
jgi:hypothetical protein